MIESSHAVFLSYASQDAEAARKICEALRASGIEVWFDQSELRGGDAWDAAIRKQIKACALFIPVISANTHARVEGYFRLEWKLAVDRSHLIAPDQPFLLPVAIDETQQTDERIPDRFRELQWSRLPGGQTPPAFVERVMRLLSAEAADAPSETKSSAAAVSPASAVSRQPAPSPASPWSRFTPLLIAAAVFIAFGYFVLERFVPSKRSAAPLATESAIPQKSVAVLPFADMSEKKDQEYFSDGLTEELIDLLSQVQDLRVPSRTSSFFFKGKQVTIAEIAKALGVAHVLEGSVRKAGDRLRVTTQLIRADDGYHLWSKTYDGNTKDIFKVQDEVAAAVVEALKAKLAPTQSVASSRTANPEAYNQYLLGRQFYNRRSLEGSRLAVEAYGRAITLDPNYAAAYAGQSQAESSVADWSGDAAGLRRAEAAAAKAIALAPGDADGYAARGELRFRFGWDWVGAQADLERALALRPTDSGIQVLNGELFLSLGRLREAIAAARRAIELDPLSGWAWSVLGFSMIASRDYPAAGGAMRRALELEPDSDFALFGLGLAQLLEGEATTALVTFQKNAGRAYRLSGGAMARHSLGQSLEAQQALDQLIATEAHGAAYQIAQVFAWRGEKAKAFEWLERAYDQRDGGLADIKADPLFASLWDDPRFARLLREINLPQ